MTGQKTVWGETRHRHADPFAEAAESEWRSAACDAPYVLTPEEEYNVSRTPEIWGGSAVIAGSAIPVFMVEDLYAEAQRVEDVQQNYPWLSKVEIHLALAYATAYAEQVGEDRARHERAIRDLFAKLD